MNEHDEILGSISLEPIYQATLDLSKELHEKGHDPCKWEILAMLACERLYVCEKARREALDPGGFLWEHEVGRGKVIPVREAMKRICNKWTQRDLVDFIMDQKKEIHKEPHPSRFGIIMAFHRNGVATMHRCTDHGFVRDRIIHSRGARITARETSRHSPIRPAQMNFYPITSHLFNRPT